MGRLVDKKHPDILRALDCFLGPPDTYVVLEFCSGGDLFNAISRLHGTPPAQTWAAGIFEQALAGVKNLHSHCQESHNDVKPENLLLDRFQTASSILAVAELPRVLLADFGCATEAGSRTQCSGGGDPRYRAPETFRGASFGFETDVWSLGVTLFEMLTGGLLIYTGVQNVCGFRAFRKLEHGNACRQLMRALYAAEPVDVGAVAILSARELLKWLLETQSISCDSDGGSSTPMASSRLRRGRREAWRWQPCCVCEHSADAKEEQQPPRSPSKKWEAVEQESSFQANDMILGW